MNIFNKKILSTATLSIFAMASLSAATVASYDGTDASYAEALETLTSVSEDSAYTVAAKGEGDFTITMYVYNTATNTFEEVYYDIAVNDYISGSTSYTQYYYTWSDDNNKYTRTSTEPTDYDFSAQGTRARASSLTGNMTGAYLVGITSSDNGGAVAIGASNKSITGSVFVGNTVTKTTTANSLGGALINSGSYTTTLIDADFIANYTSNARASYTSTGGAIHNAGTVTTLTGDFIANYAISTVAGTAQGGAINNNGTISTLTGNFIANYATTSSGTSEGGAIRNVGTISTLSADFDGNFASGAKSYGGAIYNTGTITSLSGNFTNNYASGTTEALGGAVYNTSSITFNATEGDYYYIYNCSVVNSELSDANGGFLYNTGAVEFAVSDGASITIGTGEAGYDSIAGSGTITKTGSGDLTVNSSMDYFTGTLSVLAGSMEVASITSDSSIVVDSTFASLEIDVLTVYYSSELNSLEDFISIISSTNSLVPADDSSAVTIDSLVLYLSEDFVEGDDIILYSSEMMNISSLELYTSDGTVIDTSSYSYSDGVITTGGAVPEPSTYAMIFGVVALGFAAYRRRK